MKVVIAADIFPPDIGGPATYSLKLAQELSKRGWEVKLICYSDAESPIDYPFTIVRVIRSFNVLSRYWRYLLNLFSLAAEADVIYAQGPVSAGLPAAIAAKFLKKKLVVKIVGDYAWEQARNLRRSKSGIDQFQTEKLRGKIKRLKKIETWVCRKADKVITPSQYLKKIVVGWGISENKIEVIYNSFTKPNLNSTNHDPNIIISVGRFVPWKGFSLLIDMMPELLAVNSDFKLYIFGDGPEKNTLIAKAESLRVMNRSVFIEQVSHAELMTRLAAAGIFVLNTGYEGLSHTILEALSLELPIVTTAIGGNPELIRNDESGILIEYNDRAMIKEAILRLYNDPTLRTKFVKNGLMVLPKFAESTMFESTEQLLKRQ